MSVVNKMVVTFYHEGRLYLDFDMESPKFLALEIPLEDQINLLVKKLISPKVKQLHAKLLRAKSNATTEEEFTWALKLPAAQAQLNGTATDEQTKMLEDEVIALGATGGGIPDAVNEFANLVISRSTSFAGMIGTASGDRRAVVRACLSAGTLNDAMAIFKTYEKSIVDELFLIEHAN